jgi:DNA modification methylase
MNQLIQGDCAQVLAILPANTFDAMLIDPPAAISFMGQVWDSDRGGRKQWCAWLAGVMREALRVLKPGAHGLVWAIPRRSSWTALALEDAGFEIRDCIHHYFLTGFPKNMSLDKAIDKKLGYDREVIGEICCRDIKGVNGYSPGGEMKPGIHQYTAAASPEAKEWDGWGTHLKPAIEHWWLVRKPLGEKTVAENVIKWGTGALNIDASRIPVHQPKNNGYDTMSYFRDWDYGGWNQSYKPKGTYNLTKSATFAGNPKKTPFPEGATSVENIGKGYRGQPCPADPHPDTRYPSHFIVSDCELLDHHAGFFHPPIYSPKARKCRGEGNDHPTVKPVVLMKYFATLLTRPGGHVLDCFMGSGTTGVACRELGLAFTGIEQENKFIEIARRRLVVSVPDTKTRKPNKPRRSSSVDLNIVAWLNSQISQLGASERGPFIDWWNSSPLL